MSNLFEILATLAGLLPWIPGVVAIVGGLIALSIIHRPERERPDRGDAKAVAGCMAPIVGVVGFIVLVPAIFDTDATPFIVMTAAGAVLVAGVGFLAGIAGYALLARPGIGRRAVVGALLGPLLFAGTTLALRPIASTLEKGARSAATTERAREAGLVVTIEGLEVTMGTATDTALDAEVAVVDQVIVTVTVRTEVPLEMTYLHLYRPDAPFGSPFSLEFIENVEAGEVNWRGATFEQVSRFGNGRHPGEWMLELYARDASYQRYLVRVPVSLGPS